MTVWSLILGMAILTFIPRYLPFALAGKIHLPPLLESALHYVPIAVLTAIIVQNSLIRDGAIALNFDNHHLIATLAAVFTALLSRHLFLTITVGLITYSIARFMF